MKKIFALLILATALSLSSHAAENKTLYHIVSFKYKDGTTPEQIKTIDEAFKALKTKIPQVASYAGGPAIKNVGVAKGFGHLSVLTFKSADDLETYDKSEAHQAFKKMLTDVMAEVFVYDFWAEE